ncbi:peptidylprolyl isomerase [Pseudomonas sp. ABC1]|uniref:peptidylprolyl isomerase n=1 Tax=Pseudomonas sp. ABC1 TaxID=2748080 RepID=UPI0015C37C19|nr:peptidylprolyl isomerase [Pseudomonas sp. ABC1]QLF93443.1 peptidylprolyl isomerase [Pseudomonas sp. ABC1]
MKGKTLWLGVGALAVLAAAVSLTQRHEPVSAVAATLPAVKDDTPSLARLGDQQISTHELEVLFAQLPEQVRQQLRANRPTLETWIRARLAEKALYQQAVTEGWSQRPEVQAQTQAAVEQIVLRSYLNNVSQVPDDYPSEDDLQQAYDSQKAALQIPAGYRLSQIFLAVPDKESEESVRKQAQALSKRAQAAGADFAELARTYSQDSGSAAQGGDIGLQPLAQLLPEVRGAVPKLKVGEVSAPLQSPLGFHIVKLTETQAAREASFYEVREQLRQILRTQRQEQAAKAYVDGMLNNATLSIDGAALSKLLETPQ